MTPERLATLCGMLPEWGFEGHGDCVLFWKPDDETSVMDTATQEDADHLLMEALRAVEKKPNVESVELRVSAIKPAARINFMDGSCVIKPGEPLHALLDAVREAGL